MKLNYKRTVLVGFAFFLITAFWQAYDAIVPLILTNHFGLPQVTSGFIMSFDNILAVFLLPIFGALSDKVNSKFGKRTPFILIGTVIAAIAFVALTFIDNYQILRLTDEGIPALRELINLENEAELQEILTKTLEITKANPLPLVGFVATLLLVLVAMAIFRSPAVALMPDITPKPLRSKGNAIINLMGTAGGIIVLVLGMVFATAKKPYMQYTGYVLAVVAVMLVGLIIFIISVKEKKWAEEASVYENELSDGENAREGKRTLTKAERRSFLLILLSVALWYVGYNSITSKYSVYASNILSFDYNFTLIVAQIAAVISYIPVGNISSKFGRRKTVLCGVAMLATAFFIGNFITASSPEFIMYPLFALAGIGWATINVNSFPMAVELATGSQVGKYTGYYYTASMSAQIIAPILSGFLYDLVGMRIMFFAFGTAFVALSFVTMFFVKHGDAEKEIKEVKEEK